MSQMQSTLSHIRFFIIDAVWAVWYEDLGVGGCQAHLILIEDLPEHAHIIDVREEKK